MDEFVFPPPPLPAARVRGGRRYAVNRIFCVGRNYAEHAREMGGDAREPPFFFTKPACALAHSGSAMIYPPGTDDLHHEMELVVALGAPAFGISAAEAERVIYGYACGLDMTRRDLQAVLREKRHPWDLAKAFEQSAIISEIAPVSEIGHHPRRGAITLDVNGETRQRGDLGDMIWAPSEIVAELSRYYRLGPGDVIYTGTPAGVGRVGPGDQLEGTIERVGAISLTIEGPS